MLTKKLYQPIPFDKYKNLESCRTIEDCEGRFQAIKKNHLDGSFKNETLIDLCCGNGFFCFRFIQEGGIAAVGIDNDQEVRDNFNEIAIEFKVPCVCFGELPENRYFDIGIYLDTHYHDKTTGYLEYLKGHTSTLYTSASCNADEYRCLLRTHYKHVEKIFEEGYADRIMYKCY